MLNWRNGKIVKNETQNKHHCSSDGYHNLPDYRDNVHLHGSGQQKDHPAGAGQGVAE